VQIVVPLGESKQESPGLSEWIRESINRRLQLNDSLIVHSHAPLSPPPSLPLPPLPTAATLEEVIRKLIYYQERETRELLGKNSHRLGRIVTSRSGPHGMTEIWEDGTAHKVRATLPLHLLLLLGLGGICFVILCSRFRRVLLDEGTRRRLQETERARSGDLL